MHLFETQYVSSVDCVTLLVCFNFTCCKDKYVELSQVQIMQTHQKLVQIICVHHDLFRKVGFLCYCLNGSRAIPFPLVSQSFGKPMGIVGDC